MKLFAALLLAFCSSLPAWAQDPPPTVEIAQGTQVPQPTAQQPPAVHPAATTYSNGYEVRLKIHKYASLATVPLFVTELALGQSLYNNPDTGGRRTAHGLVGAGIIGVFGLNTFTGAWNLKEGWNDTQGRKTRIIHSALMIAADGGFLAAMATAPHIRQGIITNPSDKSLHRDVAVASIGVGTVGYVLMLLRGK